MTTPQFTIDWPYGWHTRNERDVVIYCTDAPGAYPIHGRISDGFLARSWDIEGRSSAVGVDDDDLINRAAPTVSVPVDKLHDGGVYLSAPNGSYIATAAIEEKYRGRPVKWFFADEVEIEK